MTAVTTTDESKDPPIQSHDDLLAIFFESTRTKDAFRIGPEYEKFGVYEATRMPIPYEGDRGVLRILRELEQHRGFQAEGEYEGGPTIALRRVDEQITLEPGGQLELSGAQAENVHQVCAEFRNHLADIEPISKELGIRWLGLGFHPFAKRSDFAWVPKSRYGIMREYLPTRGGHALDMMLRTSTVQANFDYANEADAMRKLRIGLALSPIGTAMFANSPWYEGKPHGGVSYRARVWLDVDPDRSGLLPMMWKKGARFVDYVEWALDVPMFMFKRGGHKVVNTGQTFRSFWKNGFVGPDNTKHAPTVSDWKTHLNTLFPEVRLKNTIEVRGADAQTTPMRCALPALWTGIYYDERALDEAEALTADWGHDEVAALRESVWKDGLRTKFRGESIAKLARRVMEIAEGGLERRGVHSPSGADERVHLKKLKSLIGEGKCPADALLDGIDQEPDYAAAIIARSSLL